MASAIAVRKATSSLPLFKMLLGNGSSLRPLAAVPSAIRSFNTNTQMARYDDEGERGVDIDRRDGGRGISRRRDGFPSFFSDVLDPFSAPRSVTQLLNMMDQFMENPFLANRGMGGNRAWDVKEDENGLYIRMDMPGVDKENVKVSVEQNTLIIKGEAQKESEDEEYGRRYSSRLDLPMNMYKVDEIKAEMKNGVLKVIVPRVKEEERKDVFQVKCMQSLGQKHKMASVLRKVMANATSSCNISRVRFLRESATATRLPFTRFFSVSFTTSSESESEEKAEDKSGSDIVPPLTVKGPPEELKMENPFQSRGPKDVIAVNELKEDGGKKSVLVRVTMPGVGEDGLRVWVEENRVYFVGKGEIEREGEEESGREYGGSLKFNPRFNKVNEVKAEIKNGILRMIIPSSD